MKAEDFPIGCQVQSQNISTQYHGAVVGYKDGLVIVDWNTREMVLARLIGKEVPDGPVTPDGRPVVLPTLLCPSELYRI